MCELLSAQVFEEDQGLRLDVFLAHKWKDLSRTRIKSLIEEGHILVDHQKSSPSLSVKCGMMVTASLPDPIGAVPVAQNIPLNIIFEDEHLLVVNKSAGMVVHPAPGHYENTLVNALIAHCGDSLSGIGGVKRPGLVHRLDKGTSGLMVVAKTDRAHRGLALQFAHRSLKRTYIAIVWGLPFPLEGTIEGNIGRCHHDWRKRALVQEGGKPAITDYKVLKNYGMLASMIECSLRTGRTHQIRVHMTNKGHSLIGDPQYGKTPRGVPSRILETIKMNTDNINRPCLHAADLRFYHPVTNEAVRFSCEIPHDIQNVMEILEMETMKSPLLTRSG